MSDEHVPAEERVWESGWAGHEVAQRRRLARLPLAEKLQWLEETQRLVEQLRRGPAPPDRRPDR
jgi:hypothetical protein